MDSNAHAHPFRPTNGRESKSTLPTGTEDDGWTRMAKIIRTIDEEKVKDCKEDIDTILVFAGLFSAVVTAFLVESYHDLLPDPTDTVISLLRQIATQSNSDGNLTETRLAKNSPAPTFQPPVNAQRVNILWFISLVLSLVSASFSIIVKQWLREYLAGEYTSPQARLRIRHFRNPGLYKWRVFDIAAILPLLLQASLAFFLTGLCFFTAHVHKTVEYATIPLVAGWAFFFAAFSFLPIFDPACPYKTPFLKTPIRLFRKWSLKSWPLRHHVFVSRFTSLDFQPRLLTSEINHIRGESHVVHDNTNDLKIILAVDAIQADDRLVKDMWRILQVTKSKPPVLCDFLLAVIGNRLQCDVSKAVPYSLLDLTPLPQETYDSLISMVTEVVESEVYRYTSASLGSFNQENHSSFAWLERLVCVLLSTSRFPHSEATNSVLLSYFSKDRHTTLLSTICSGLYLQSNQSGLRSLLMQLSGPLMLAQQDNPKLLITVLRQLFAPQPQRRHSNQPSFSISVEGSLVPFLDVPLPCHDLVLQLLRPLITTTGLDSNQIATLLALDAIRPENRVLTALPDAFEQRHINAQEYCDFVLAAVRHRLPRSAGVNTVRDLDEFMSSSDDVHSTVAHMVASLLVHAESLFTSPRHSTCPTPDTGSWLEKCILLLLTGSAHCTEQVSVALKPWFYYDQLFNVLLRIMRASADTRSHDFLSPFSRLQQALLLGWSTDVVLTRLEQIFQIRLDRPHEPTKLWQPLQTFYPGDDNTQPLSPPHRDFLHALYTKRLMLTAMNDLEIQYWTISDSFMLQEVLEHKGFRETADLVKSLLLSPSSCGSEGTAVFWQIAFGRDSLASMTVIRKTSHCAYEYVFKNLKSYERSQILHHLTQSLEASSSKSAAPTLFSDFKFTYDPVITCVAHLRILSNLCQTKQELGRDLRVSFFRVFKQLIPPLKEMTYDCQSNFEDYEDMADEALKLINTIVPLLQRPVPTALPRFVPLPVGLPHALHPLFRSRDPPAMRIHWEELDQQLDLVPVTNKNDVPSFSIVGVKNEGATLLLVPDDQPLAQEESGAAVTLSDSRRPTVHRLRLVIPSTPDPTYDHPSRMYRRVSELGVDSSRQHWQLEDGSPAHPSAITHRHYEGSESPNDIDNGDEHSDKAFLAKDSDSNKPWSTGSHQPKGAAGDSAYSAVTSAHSVHDTNSLGLSGLPHNPGHRLYVSEAYLDLHLDPETLVSVIVDSESDSIDSAPEGDKKLKPPTTITSRASIH